MPRCNEVNFSTDTADTHLTTSNLYDNNDGNANDNGMVLHYSGTSSPSVMNQRFNNQACVGNHSNSIFVGSKLLPPLPLLNSKDVNQNSIVTASNPLQPLSGAESQHTNSQLNTQTSIDHNNNGIHSLNATDSHEQLDVLSNLEMSRNSLPELPDLSISFDELSSNVTSGMNYNNNSNSTSRGSNLNNNIDFNNTIASENVTNLQTNTTSDIQMDNGILTGTTLTMSNDPNSSNLLNHPNISLVTKETAVYITKHGKQRVVCDCGQIGCLGDYANIKSLNEHKSGMLNQLSNKSYPCPQKNCSKTFSTYFKLLNHVNSHNKRFVCNALNIKYNVKDIKKIIKKDANGKNPVARCQKRFGYKSNVKPHLSSFHKMNESQIAEHDIVSLDIDLSEIYAGTEFATLYENKKQSKTSHTGKNVNDIDMAAVTTATVSMSSTVSVNGGRKSRGKKKAKKGIITKKDSKKNDELAKKKRLKRRTKLKKSQR